MTLKDEIDNEARKCEGCTSSDCYGCSTYSFLSNLDPSTGDE